MGDSWKKAPNPGEAPKPGESPSIDGESAVSRVDR